MPMLQKWLWCWRFLFRNHPFYLPRFLHVLRFCACRLRKRSSFSIYNQRSSNFCCSYLNSLLNNGTFLKNRFCDFFRWVNFFLLSCLYNYDGVVFNGLFPIRSHSKSTKMFVFVLYAHYLSIKPSFYLS